MHRLFHALAVSGVCQLAAVVQAHAPSQVAVEIIGADGQTFREFPLDTRGDALRSYLQAEKGARYEVRVRNTSGQRLGLVIAVDGRNIITGRKSELARDEPMYVLEAWDTQDYLGWRASLEAVNEFYFTEWSDSYAEAFGDRSARGVIAVAVYREVPPAPVYQPYSEEQRGRVADAQASAGAAPPASRAAGAEEKSESGKRRDESAGTGYGERRLDRAMQVEFVAQSSAASKHFIKYEWRETLCHKGVLECGDQNRFWDESTLGFAPPPPRQR